MTIDKTKNSLSALRTTGIGSLPHHNADTALEFSFKLGIPFLPQLPRRNPGESMIPQALEGLPGLQIDTDGTAILRLDVWQTQSQSFAQRLDHAFARQEDSPTLEEFEPTAEACSSWKPFLWELQERGQRVAKIQMAGPLTAQWAIRLTDGSRPDQHPELSTQIFKLILARATAMVSRLVTSGIQPICFLDEPGMYAFSLSQPQHVLRRQELKLLIQTLRKAGAIVGIHCCSNTQWEALLSLGLDLLSIDTHLSLSHALATADGRALENFILGGGRLSLGVIPTEEAVNIAQLDSRVIGDEILAILGHHWEAQPKLAQRLLREALYTPACGLALQSISEAEVVLAKLGEVYEYLNN
jgi:hypothetical protein